MSRYLICYDIGDRKMRDKLALRLEKAGMRIQLSVFIVECGREEYEILAQELQSFIGNDDSLLCLPICESCFAKALLMAKERPLMCFF